MIQERARDWRWLLPERYCPRVVIQDERDTAGRFARPHCWRKNFMRMTGLRYGDTDYINDSDKPNFFYRYRRGVFGV